MPTLPTTKRPSYLPKKAHTGNLRSDDVHKTAKWKRTSSKLRKTAVCEPCQFITGHLHPSQDVDHIFPLPLGAAFDEANLMPMCKLMHGKKSQLDKEGFRIASQRGLDGLIPVNREDILIALRDFDNRGSDTPLDVNWI